MLSKEDVKMIQTDNSNDNVAIYNNSDNDSDKKYNQIHPVSA